MIDDVSDMTDVTPSTPAENRSMRGELPSRSPCERRPCERGDPSEFRGIAGDAPSADAGSGGGGGGGTDGEDCRMRSAMLPADERPPEPQLTVEPRPEFVSASGGSAALPI